MATLPGTAPPWSTMPLPQGWEAKYEPQIGRYFYINHSNKKTQWVDPRKAVYEAQQRSPSPPRQAYIPMQLITKPKCRTCKTNEVDFEGGTCNPCKVTEQQREISLMRAREQMEAEKQRQEQKAKLDKERERRRVQSAQRRQEPKPAPPVVETTFSEPTIDKEAVKHEMRHLFANTQASVVDMILETYDFNKDEAKVALRQMGQRIVNQPMAKKPSPKSSPKKAAISAAQKQRVKANLKKSFPHVDDMMIEMAVESTNYSEEKSSAILIMLKTTSSPTKGGATQGGGITTGQIEVTFPETSTTNSVTVGQADTSKAVTFPASTPSASTTTVASSSTAVASTSDSQKRPTASAVISSPAKKPAAATRSSSPPKKPTVFKSAMPSKKTITGPKKQSHALLVGSKYVAHPPSSFTTGTLGAKGSDPNMAKGPDISNLLQDYMQNMGPDPDNLSGSNKENIMGPVESTGRDSSLAMGPDIANRSGPNSSLAKGSMYKRPSCPESAMN